MRNGKELVGRPIYGINDGRQVGSVKDLFVDLDLKLLKGIYIGREGLINRKVRFIAREKVAVFGIDAVLTSKSDVIDDNSQVVCVITISTADHEITTHCFHVDRLRPLDHVVPVDGPVRHHDSVGIL